MIDYPYLPEPHRIQVKIFSLENMPEKDVLIQRFHSWIQQDLIEELMIDVADYSHVPDGPGIMLIGHAFDYAFDDINGPGLRYTRKRAMPSSLTGAVLHALEYLLIGCTLFNTDEASECRFDTSVFELRVLDRRLYPTSEQTANDVQQVLSSVLCQVFDVEDVAQEMLYTDSRFPFSLRFTIPAQRSVDSILSSIRAVHVLETTV